MIVPYLRGYGTARFRSDDAVRNGQQSVLAVDAIALLDALGVDEAIVAGFDWGARTANVMAALWPERSVCSTTGDQRFARPGSPGASARARLQIGVSPSQGGAGLSVALQRPRRARVITGRYFGLRSGQRQYSLGTIC